MAVVTILGPPTQIGGGLTGADKTKFESITAGAAVAEVGIGEGLVNSGSVTNPIMSPEAGPDGSIVVDGSGIQVGALATDAQHGIRGGGALLHDEAVPLGASGFMPGEDKHKLDTFSGWGVVTTDGVGGITLRSELNVTSAAIIGGGTALTITLAHAMADEYFAVVFGCAPGTPTFVSGSSTTHVVHFVDNAGANFNLSTGATRITFAILGARP